MSDDRNTSSSSSIIDTGISHSRKTVKSYGISIDSSKIHEVAVEEQPESLRELGVNVFDQDVFEEGVLQQVDEAIAAQEEALEKQRLEKDLKSVEEQLRYLNTWPVCPKMLHENWLYHQHGGTIQCAMVRTHCM